MLNAQCGHVIACSCCFLSYSSSRVASGETNPVVLAGLGVLNRGLLLLPCTVRYSRPTFSSSTPLVEKIIQPTGSQLNWGDGCLGIMAGSVYLGSNSWFGAPS